MLNYYERYLIRYIFHLFKIALYMLCTLGDLDVAQILLTQQSDLLPFVKKGRCSHKHTYMNSVKFMDATPYYFQTQIDHA